MAVNDENSDVIYEVNKKGQRVVVRSIISEQCVYIRFINRVSRPVDVWWRDFQGLRRHYVRMPPHTRFDIDTYVTHPWEFTDAATNENYLIRNKKIFRVPAKLAGMKHRTSWIISVNIRSLRSTVLLALAEHLEDASKVPDLSLPRELSNDLAALLNVVQNPPEPPPHT